MQRSLKLRLNQRGDTLVEVLICMAVVGAVLSGAYVSASRSLRIGRQAQERTEAIKLAEQQLEGIRLTASGSDTAAKNIMFNISPTRMPFCVVTTGGVVSVAEFSGPIPDTLEDDTLAVAPDGNYRAECHPPQSFYFIGVRYQGTSATGGIFVITVRWDRIGGGVDETRLLYELYRST
jgi:prepilin-type N-terminal cleavage/methylation domain-containing protein